MVAFGETTVNVSRLLPTLIVKVKVVGTNELRIGLWFAAKLLRLVSLLIPCEIEFQGSYERRDEAVTIKDKR